MKKILKAVIFVSFLGLFLVLVKGGFSDDVDKYLQEHLSILLWCIFLFSFFFGLYIFSYTYSEEYHKHIDRWWALCYRLGVKWGWDKDKALVNLLNLYTEPDRAYHTLTHIEDCLKEFDQVRRLAVNPDALEMALWLHDVIYDPKEKDNEARSADYAMSVLREAGISEELCVLVGELILITKHTIIPSSLDKQLIVDIDLSIFGQSEERFDEYEQQIREEYKWVSDWDFAVERTKILQSFLDRPAIYLTEFSRNKYEKKARENIARSLARLLR
jgi:predicted metal-dependent HD superfamily phosphohydrolase